MRDYINSLENGFLSIYALAGYPSSDSLPLVVKTLIDQGIPLVEVGMPFSDSLVDGPVIQQASEQALSNGMTMSVLFEQLATLSTEYTSKCVIMGSFNPVLQFGVEKFLQHCQKLGIQSCILPDLPVEVYEQEYQQLFNEYQISMAFLVTDRTSEERIRYLDSLSSSFLYAVSSAGVTGSQIDVNESRAAYLKRLQDMNLENPFVVGFGVHDRNSYRALAEYAQGVIVGSDFLRSVAEDQDLANKVTAYLQKFS